MKLSGAIEDLIGAEIDDPEALITEAKERVQEYFKANDEKRWEMCSPTYRSKYSRGHFIDSCEDWFPLLRDFTVKSVLLNSGVLATVEVEMVLEGDYKITRSISLIKEKGEYQPDGTYPFTIVGQTAPPYNLR